MDLIRRLASRSALIFVVRLGGAGLMFVLQAAMARLWGAALLGHFLLIIAAINLTATVLPLGFETISSYFAADYQARGQGRALRGFLVRAYGHIAVVGAVMAVAGHAAAGWLGEAGSVLQGVWPAFALMATATAIIFVNGGTLIGLKRPLAGFTVDGLARPLLMLGGFLVALVLAQPSDRLATLVWFAAIGYALTAAVHVLYVIHAVRGIEQGEAVPRGEGRRWWRFAVPWMITALATDFFYDLDLLHLSTLMTPDDLAAFGVAARIFGLLAFAVSTVYAVSLPHVFDSAAANDQGGVSRKIGDTNLAAAALAALILIGSLLGGPVVPLVFGPAFAGSGPVLSILSLSLLVRALVGPASVVLSMNDRPYASVPVVGLSLVALVGGNVLAVPAWGLVGAAISASVASTIWSVGMWLTALRITGTDVSILPRVRELLALRRGQGGATPEGRPTAEAKVETLPL